MSKARMSSARTSSVSVKGLTKRYGSVAAVSDVSFEVPTGGTLALLGPSGCGKTTILRCLAGLETPDQGSIEIDGEPVFDRSRHRPSAGAPRSGNGFSPTRSGRT